MTHKHKWQFVQIIRDFDVYYDKDDCEHMRLKKRSLEFVCECGKLRLVTEK